MMQTLSVVSIPVARPTLDLTCLRTVCGSHHSQYDSGYFVFVPGPSQRKVLLDHEYSDFALRESLISNGQPDPGRTLPNVREPLLENTLMTNFTNTHSGDLRRIGIYSHSRNTISSLCPHSYALRSNHFPFRHSRSIPVSPAPFPSRFNLSHGPSTTPPCQRFAS